MTHYVPIHAEQIPEGYRPWKRDSRGVLFAVGERELTAAEYAEIDLAAAEAEEEEAAEEEILAEFRDVPIHQLSDDELDRYLEALG